MAEKRNIVLITLDSVRADHCSFMGYHRKTTPTMDKMAKKGLVFENAVAPGPRTIPSMPQIFTGKLMCFPDTDPYTGERENVRRHLKLNKTLPEMMKELGYTTGAFCPNAYTSRYFGFNKGFDYFQDFLFAKKSHQKIFEKMIKGNKLFLYLRNIRNLILKQEAFRSWDSYYNEILEWVEKVKEPFFLWVFLLDTHLPWIVPRKYRKWSSFVDTYYYNWKMFRLLGKRDYTISNSTREKFINLYDDSILYADRFIANIIKDLSDSDPIFIVHSDHGEEFGERGYYGHYYPHMYEENIHVPFIIYGVDVIDSIKRPTSLINLKEFVFNLNSLERLIYNLDKYTVSKDFDYVTKCIVIAIRVGQWKFIFESFGHNSNKKLYNLIDDPMEKNNLIEEGYNELCNYMSKILDRVIFNEMKVRKLYNVAKNLKKGGING